MPESIIATCQERTQGLATALQVPLASSGDIPSRPAAKGDNSVNQPIPTKQEVMNMIVSQLFRHLDPSTSEEINRFVQHIEKIRKALIVDVNQGSLILTVKCNSLEILQGLWEDYSTGLLGELAQTFLVTKEILEELGLVEVKLKTTILEEDYRACQNILIKISGKICFSPVL